MVTFRLPTVLCFVLLRLVSYSRTVKFSIRNWGRRFVLSYRSGSILRDWDCILRAIFSHIYVNFSINPVFFLFGEAKVQGLLLESFNSSDIFNQTTTSCLCASLIIVPAWIGAAVCRFLYTAYLYACQHNWYILSLNCTVVVNMVGIILVLCSFVQTQMRKLLFCVRATGIFCPLWHNVNS